MQIDRVIEYRRTSHVHTRYRTYGLECAVPQIDLYRSDLPLPQYHFGKRIEVQRDMQAMAVIENGHINLLLRSSVTIRIFSWRSVTEKSSVIRLCCFSKRCTDNFVFDYHRKCFDANRFE